MFTIENFLAGLELLLDFKVNPKILFLIYLRQNDFEGCQNWKKNPVWYFTHIKLAKVHFLTVKKKETANYTVLPITNLAQAISLINQKSWQESLIFHI